MAMRPDEIREAEKLAKQFDEKLKVKGKSVLYDDKKYTSLHDFNNAIDKKNKK